MVLYVWCYKKASENNKTCWEKAKHLWEPRPQTPASHRLWLRYTVAIIPVGRPTCRRQATICVTLVTQNLLACGLSIKIWLQSYLTTRKSELVNLQMNYNGYNMNSLDSTPRIIDTAYMIPQQLLSSPFFDISISFSFPFIFTVFRDWI